MRVLCCCNPENEVGSVPVLRGLQAGLELRRWRNDDDESGLAFASNHQPVEVLQKIPGFKSNIILAGDGKTWEAGEKDSDKKKKKKKKNSSKRRARILDDMKVVRDRDRKN
jgi:hypothetical protein